MSYGASEDNLLVYVRDADDAIWARQEYARAGQWTSWHKVGKQRLPGAAPTALYTDRGISSRRSAPTTRSGWAKT